MMRLDTRMIRRAIRCAVLLALALPLLVRAQSFRFTPQELKVTGAPGDRLGCHAEVKNLLSQKQTIHIQRLRNQIPTEWMSSFCLNQCYAPFTDEADEEVPANATMTFTIYFDTDPVNEAAGEVDIRLYALTNPSESYQLTFTGLTKHTTSAVGHETPSSYALKQNYPNPFNPTTNIQFAVPKTSHVALRIYDLLGREVKTLSTGMRQAGTYTLQWDGRSNDGQTMHAGYYLYKLQAGNFTETKKMLLLK